MKIRQNSSIPNSAPNFRSDLISFLSVCIFFYLTDIKLNFTRTEKLKQNGNDIFARKKYID